LEDLPTTEIEAGAGLRFGCGASPGVSTTRPPLIVCALRDLAVLRDLVCLLQIAMQRQLMIATDGDKDIC
jgi:hypothetical protein